jgi:hypothetical protein
MLLLYSIACGVGCAGIVLLASIAVIMLYQSKVAGAPFRVFKTAYGFEWSMIFMAVFGIAGTAWGLSTAIMLGYRPVDLFVTIISAILAYATGWIIAGSLNDVGRRKYPKQPRHIH